MHPLLRTLDMTAGAGTESSVHDLHPIQQAASARSHGVPILLSLGLTPLLIYGLSISLLTPASTQAVHWVVDRAQRSVSLLLHETDVAPATRHVLGPEGPGGDGHREGTNTLDPRLVAHTTILSTPSDAVDPDELGTTPRAERVYLSLNPALPLQTGGNGLAHGSGRDSARGSGGLLRLQEPAPRGDRGEKLERIPDGRLVAIRKPELHHGYRKGDLEEEVWSKPVVVRIWIGEDGIPIRGYVVSGPERLHAAGLKTALLWRFEPLGPHGLVAPLALNVVFRPRSGSR
ncbi:MAG: hypothetical protein H6P99_1444 [Holophagaceae bacterium]|nr:hypothetical protein [Holophagaceae bacterium]